MKKLTALLSAVGLPLLIGGTAGAAWFEQDIGQAGNPAFTQIFEQDPGTGAFTVYGGGDDIWGNEDEFHFVYDDVPLIGDAVIQAQVTSLDITNSWSKAGVMIRNELSDISTHAQMLVSGDPRAAFQWRPLSGAGSLTATTTGPPEGTKPYWIRLTRFGDTLTGYRSADGETWIEQGSVDIPMVTPYIGMAVTSHDNTQLAAATFTDVALARVENEYTWAGGSGNWNSSTKWNPSGIPGEMSKAILNTGTISVTDDESVFTLQINGGSVNIGAGRSLDVVGSLYAGAGSISMGADSEVSFQYGGGDLGTLTFAGTSVVLPSGSLSVNNLRTLGSGAEFIMEGGGAMDVGAVSVRPDTVFNVAAGKLTLGGANPLGVSTEPIMLTGGTIGFRGVDAIVDNVIAYGFYDGLANTELATIDDNLANGENGGVFLATPTSTQGWTGELWQQGAMSDTYTQMWSGFFKAPETGTYEFYVHGDDYEVLFIDKNRNGEFDGLEEFVTNNAPPDGWNTPKTGTIDLTAGQTYEWALAHNEGGGGDFLNFEIGIPSAGAGNRTRINPSLPAQDGWWSASGTRAVNLPGADFVVTEDSGIDVISDQGGTFGTLTLQNGIITTTGKSVTFANAVVAPTAEAVGVDPQADATDFGTIDGGAALNQFVFSKAGPGDLTIKDGYIANMQKATIDANGGTLTMLNDEAWAGSTAMRLSGGRMVVASNILNDIVPGLTFGFFAENARPIDTSIPNPENGTLDRLGPTITESTSNPPWTPYTTYVYTGQIYDEDGRMSFFESVDDETWIQVDGQVVLHNTQWNVVNASGVVNVTPGWVDFEARFNPGGGGLGRVGTMGFGFDPTGQATSTNAADYILPRNVDANTASLFRTGGVGPRDLTSHTVEVTADSELSVGNSLSLALGPLTIDPDATLTTTGSPISFASTAVSGDAEATVGIAAMVNTTLTAASGMDFRGREITVEIGGDSRVIVDKTGTGMENTTFELYGGELVGLIDPTGTTFGPASFSFNGGGLLLSSTGGDQTFDTPLPVEGNGKLGAAEVLGGVPDVTLTLGSAANGITLSNAAVLSLEAADGYTLVVDGPVTGLGGIRATAGTVNVTAAAVKDYGGPTAVSAGTMTVDAPLPNTSNIEVTGGAMVLNQPVTTNGLFVPDQILYGFYDGATAAIIAGTDDGALNGADGGLFNLTPTRNQKWVDEVWQQGNMDDTYSQMWNGVFIPPTTGTYGFDVHGDDFEVFYVDLNQNGEFDGAAEHITDNVPPEGWNTPKNGTADLIAGQQYQFVLAHSEGGGGDFLNFTLTPPGDVAVRANPTLQPGWWGYATPSTTRVDGGSLEVNAPLVTGRVSVAGGGTMDVSANGSVTADALSVSGGAVYNTRVPAAFRSVTLRGGGTVLTNGNQITIGESLTASSYAATVEPGGDFRVMGEDLAAGFDTLMLNGEVTLAGPRAPISHWGFDDGAGDTAINSVDPSLNGTLTGLGTNGPAWTSRGKLDGAVMLDGQGYIDLPDGFADFTGGITVSAWVYHTDYPNWGRIIDFGNGAGIENIVLAHRGTTGDARWMFYGTAGGNESIDPNGVFSQWNWQHIVATCDDGPVDGATMKLYRDGVLLHEEGGHSVPANVVRTNNYIGESNWTADDFFKGYVDEMMIWDRGLSAQEVADLHLAGVLGKAAPDFTQVDLSGTLGGTGTLNGDLTLSGQIMPSAPDGGGSGTIKFRGEVHMTPDTSTVLTMAPEGMSQLDNMGNSDVFLDGELKYQIQGIKAEQEGKEIVVSIVDSLSEGVIQGNFAVVPTGTAAAPAHIDQGVFHKGVAYIDTFPPTIPPSYFSADATFFVATGGDANGDGRVDGQDITNLITNFSRPGDPADRNWLKSDTAGGLFGRGDGNVDGQDITDLISNFTGDAGPAANGTAADGTAAAEYNPATGEVRVMVDGVMNWSLISNGEFTDAGLNALADVLPLANAANLASLNENTIGEGGFGGTISYGNVALGAIVPAGTDPSTLTLEYVTGFGAEPQIGTINVVPEPGTLVLLAGATLLLMLRRQRGRRD